MKKIRLIELFGGIGAQAKALENLGVNFEHHGMVEFDAQAVCAYNAVHGTNFTTSDITKITGNDLNITETDKYNYIMTYSFPCQDLSPAGKRKGMDKDAGTRSGLLWEVERLLNESTELPQVLVMENVPDVHNKTNVSNFTKWMNFLASKGYTSFWKDITSEDFNSPQHRKRCYMVSILNSTEDFVFPTPIERTIMPQDLLENQDLDMSNKTLFVEDGVKDSVKCNFIRDAADIITTDKDVFKCECTSGWADNQIGIKLVPTLRAQNNCTYVLTKDLHAHKLTPCEAWRFMGFETEDYDKARAAINETFHKGKDRSKTALYKQAGNSIVVNVLEYLFKQILEILN